MSMPTRIWAESASDRCFSGSWQREQPNDEHWNDYPRQSHYVRADIADELLAALKDSVCWMGPDEVPRETIDAALAAIARAEGKE